MSSPRQMVISTLKDIAHECLREQTKLVMVVHSKRLIEEREKELLGNIKVLKLRLNRELLAHKDLLGVGTAFEDDEGEEWKEKG